MISANNPPYNVMGRDMVDALGTRFYDVMEATEPALTAVHRLQPAAAGAAPRVALEVRARFTLFLVGWLGGPQTYHETHGHPRLRMRHAHVRIDAAMRDAWLRCMNTAMVDVGVPDEVRSYLSARFAEVADFLRNDPAAEST
jgi:hemoglobin